MTKWRVYFNNGSDAEVEAERYNEGDAFVELVYVRDQGTSKERQDVVFAARKDFVWKVVKLPES